MISHVDIDNDTARLLVRDRVVVRKLRRRYGPDGRFFAWAITNDREDELRFADPDISDFLADTLSNEARLYKRITCRGSAAGAYHVEVMGLGGVYFVRAAEFGDSDLFTDIGEAESWAQRKWWDDAIGTGRQYREEFDEYGKDAVDQRPLAPAAIRAGQKRRLEREQREHQRLNAEKASLA